LKKQANGFTLIELVIVIAFMGILMAIAYPSFSQWRENLRYKEAARRLASAMTEARSRAIAQNLEHELAFDLGVNTYMLRQGNRAMSTLPYSSNPGDWTIIYSNQGISNPLDIRARSDCADNTANNFRFQFFPNGTVRVNGSENIGTTGHICVLDQTTGTRKFLTGVSSASTGRVVVRKWNAASNNWQ
jgi:prepilin-type N-terminal cleavage/methylation domain-containing protein